MWSATALKKGGYPQTNHFTYRFENGIQGYTNYVSNGSFPLLQSLKHRRNDGLPVSVKTSHKSFRKTLEALSCNHDTIDVCITLHSQCQRLGKLSKLSRLLYPGRSIEEG